MTTVTLNPPAWSLPKGFLPWLFLASAAALITILMQVLPWLAVWPENWIVPLSDLISGASAWFVDNFKWFFRAISAAIEVPMQAIQYVLHWLPWPATIAFFVLFALRFGSRGLAVFTFFALFYMVLVGYWEESMNTLALVAISVPLSIAVGLIFGVLAFRSARFNAFVQPTLDLMQTVPAFAYLIPILFLFGFGPVVGVIASIIFASPPMVRNTILGLREVPADIIDSGIMSGCKPRQLFWQVELPTATPQLLIGVNQSTMAALSMVIIAAIIGGFDDIGWEVLSTMRKAQFGESLLAGLVIALLAMVLDRLSAAVATQSASGSRLEESLLKRNKFLLTGLAALVVFKVLGLIFPSIASYPATWTIYPADALNTAMRAFVSTFGDVLDSVKTSTLFYLMFPIRNGFDTSVNPFTWGFSLTPIMIWAYALVAAGMSAWAFARGQWRRTVVIAAIAYILYFGLTGTPWAIFIGIVTLLAYQGGGWKTALLAFFSMVFILLNGLWEPAMLSIYLCTVAVFISFTIGGFIGIWAAHNDTVSRIVRPINDTLQTMPPFVLLIPVLMLFKVGEFTAMLAIISYAIVPAIRYVEHGLRSVPENIVEAATQVGCTSGQLLLQVKLPIALPVIMLGLNQTIMYGLAMLVIAALVGTQGLGQQIYLALTQADMGRGIVTGVSMALIAMVADRIIQAFSRKWQASLT